MFAIPKIPVGEVGEGEDQEEGGKSASNGSLLFSPPTSPFTRTTSERNPSNAEADVSVKPFSCPVLEHVDKLAEILLTYVLFEKDLGYVQGMSDLAAPLYVVMEGEEVATFWCFVEFMERMVRFRDSSFDASFFLEAPSLTSFLLQHLIL